MWSSCDPTHMIYVKPSGPTVVKSARLNRISEFPAGGTWLTKRKWNGCFWYFPMTSTAYSLSRSTCQLVLGNLGQVNVILGSTSPKTLVLLCAAVCFDPLTLARECKEAFGVFNGQKSGDFTKSNKRTRTPEISLNLNATRPQEEIASESQCFDMFDSDFHFIPFPPGPSWTILDLLQQGVGACSAGIECLNFWLSDDQECSSCDVFCRCFRLQSSCKDMKKYEKTWTIKKRSSQLSWAVLSQWILGTLETLVPAAAARASKNTQGEQNWRNDSWRNDSFWLFLIIRYYKILYITITNYND